MKLRASANEEQQYPGKEVRTRLREFTEGVLEGLAYSRMVLRNEKQGRGYAKITDRILKVLDASVEDFEERLKATA
jgi:hypothetical protein